MCVSVRKEDGDTVGEVEVGEMTTLRGYGTVALPDVGNSRNSIMFFLT